LNETEGIFNDLIKERGEKPIFLRIISEIEIEQGHFKTAYGNLSKLVKMEPENFANYIGLLVISYGLAAGPKSPEESIAVPDNERKRYLEEASLRVREDSIDDNYLMGSVFRRAGDFEQAERFLLKAEKLDPKNPSTLMEIATLYSRAGKYDEALKRIIPLYNASPNDASLANFYGYTLAEKGEELDLAEKLLNKALEKEPQNGYYLDSFAWIRFKKGYFQEALKILQRAVEKAGDDAVIWEHIGDTYQKLSKPENALEAYQKSLSLDPGSASVNEKVEKIKAREKLDKTH
jgi:tetratricopeptide (TPR) repeat protein